MEFSLPAKALLWRNTLQLMTLEWGGANLTRLAKEAQIGDATAFRLKESDDSDMRISVIDKIARLFDRPQWLLLHPQGPGAARLSDDAAKLAALYDSLPDEKKVQAYAIIEQLVRFGNTGPR